MNNAILIQQAEGPSYREMLNATSYMHAAYCKRHDVDQWVLRGHLSTDAIAWDKLRMMTMAIDSGYEHIFWLDSDTIIVGDEDLRTAVPDDYDLGMTWQISPGGGPLHFNVGAIYCRGSVQLRTFLADLISRMPQQPYTRVPYWWDDEKCEQVIFNQMLADGAYDVKCAKLDYKWNSIYLTKVENPVVLGYHGFTSDYAVQLIRSEIGKRG